MLSFVTQHAMPHPAQSGERSVLTLGFLSLPGWMQREFEKRNMLANFVVNICSAVKVSQIDCNSCWFESFSMDG